MLGVFAVGCVSPVGLDAAQTCAAVRARQSGIEAVVPQAGEPLLAARVPARHARRASAAWLRRLLVRALRECLAAYVGDPRRLALFIALPEPARHHAASLDGTGHAFMRRTLSQLGRPFSPHSRVLLHGHASAVLGLQEAARLLASGDIDGALVGGADSLLNDIDRERLHAAGRLHEPGNPFGLIPGEAAAFFAVGNMDAPFSCRAMARLAGWGLGMEPDDIQGQDRYSVAQGLKAALDAALAEAGLDEAGIDWRITDINGERYRSWESTAMLARAYRAWRDGLPCLHVPAATGDVGCASLALQIVLGADAMQRGHAPGPLAVCESSSEGPLRAACLVVAHGDDAPPFHSVVPLAADSAPACIASHVDRLPHELAWMAAHRRQAAKGAQTFNQFADLDDRLDAGMAYLRTLGRSGWQAASAALEMGEPGAAFAPTVLALESADAERLLAVLRLLPPDGTPAAADSGVHAALGWTSARALRDIGLRMAESSLPLARRLAATAMHLHRVPMSPATTRLLGDPDAQVRARALRLAADAGHTGVAAAVEDSLAHGDGEVRFQAARALVLLGHADRGAATLRLVAAAPGMRQGDAWRWLLRSARPPDAWALLASLARDSSGPQGLRQLIESCGVVGDVRSVPWLIEQMAHAAVQRLAGEAMAVITGIDLDAPAVRPQADSAQDEAADDAVDAPPDLDGDLHPVDPSRVAHWWHLNGDRFTDGVRYFLGEPLSVEGCLRVLAQGRQRHRIAAAEHLCLARPGTVLFPVAAPAWRQRRLLAAWEPAA